MEAKRFDAPPPAEDPQSAGGDPARIVDAAAEKESVPAAAGNNDGTAPAQTKENKSEVPAAESVPAAGGRKDSASFTATPPEPTGGTVYEVKAGDTLSAIAKRFYGDAGASGVIERANVDLVKNPNRLRPGMKLIIPKL